MRIVPWCVVLLLHAAAGLAQAQTFNDVQVRLGAYTLNRNGGEKPVGVWWSTGPVVIGKPLVSTFSVGEPCEAFAASADGSLMKNATAAWRIELTAIRIVRDAITVRLRSQMAGFRMRRDGKSLEFSEDFPAKDDIELTLRPGESWPLINVRNIYRYSCETASSIRVSADSYPWEEDERRLASVDLWLVERLSNGTEAQRSQPLAVRSVPNRPFRFYFDSIVDRNVSLDIYGILQARLESGSMAITVETRSRWDDSSHPRNSSGPQRSVESVIKVKPDEIVEIPLPKLGDDAGPFGNRQLSIRIRARQLR